MGITSYQAATTDIPLPDGPNGEKNSFTVRGLGLDDFGVLITNNLSAITQAAEAYAIHKAEAGNTASLQGFVLIVLRDFPGLMMEVISVAADEPAAKNKRLPMAVQMAALTEIARLTVIDAGGLGNLLAMLGSALKGVGGDSLNASLQQVLSRSSIGGSGKK